MKSCRRSTLALTMGVVLFGGLLLLSKFPVTSIPRYQYHLDESENLSPEVATTSGAYIDQTALEKAQELVVQQKQIPLADDAFEQWNILENSQAGYRFAYPAGFHSEPEYGKIELTPPDQKGKLVVYIRGDSFDVKFLDDNLDSSQRTMILAAKQLVEETFEFTEQRTVNQADSSDRFRKK